MDEQLGYLQQQSLSPFLYGGSGTPSFNPYVNLNGIPGMAGAQGMLAQMLVQPFLSQMFGPGNIQSQFSPTSNLYVQQRKMLEFNQMNQAMQKAQEGDRETYTRLLRGMAISMGADMTPDRERIVRQMAGDFSVLAPTLAQVMPNTFDRLHGIRGSSMLMAQQMFMGGRYSFDPVTRMPKLSVESVGAMTNQIHEMLYGPGANLAEMRGIGAGRAGQLFDEMQRRGLGVPLLSSESQRREMASLYSSQTGMDFDQSLATISKLSRDNPQFQSLARDLESGRIGQKLKDMAGAISAMQDIFGDMGQPDAPMAQIMEGLQVITQNGLNQLSPQKVERMVRETANLARVTGVGMDNMMQLVAGSAQIADRYGMDRRLGLTATQHSTAFGQSYGVTVGGTPRDGRLDKTTMTLLDQRLTMGAAKSDLVNRFAATVRLSEEVGAFGKGTEAEAVLEAIRNGNTTYSFEGQQKSLNIQEGQFRSILQKGLVAGGMDETGAIRAVNDIMYQKGRNESVVARDNLDSLGRKMQADTDLKPLMMSSYSRAFRTMMGVDQATADDYARRVIEAGFQDSNLAQDPERLMQAIGIGKDWGTPEQRDKFSKAIRLGFGNVDQLVRANPALRQYRSAQGLYDAQNRETIRTSDTIRQTAQVEARMESAMSGLGRGSALQRLVDAFIENPGAEGGIKDIAAKVLGFIPQDEVLAEIEPLIKQLQGEVDTYNSASTKFENADDAAKARQSALKKMEEIVPLLREKGARYGFDAEGGSAYRELNSALEKIQGNRPGSNNAVFSSIGNIINDPKAIDVLGPGGVEKLRQIQQTTTKLSELSAGATGGDVNALFTTVEQRNEARQIQAAKNQITAELEALEKTKASLTTPEQIARFNEQKSKLQERMQTIEVQSSAVKKATGSTVESLSSIDETKLTPETLREARELRESQRKGLEEVRDTAKQGIGQFSSKRNALLQKLSEATTPEERQAIAKEIENLKQQEQQERRQAQRLSESYGLDDATVFDRFAKSIGTFKTKEERSKFVENAMSDDSIGARGASRLRRVLPLLENLKEKAGTQNFADFVASGGRSDAERKMIEDVQSQLGKDFAKLSPEELNQRLQSLSKKEPVSQMSREKVPVTIEGPVQIQGKLDLATGIIQGSILGMQGIGQ